MADSLNLPDGDHQLHQQIDAYLRGAMTYDELQQFEEQMKANPLILKEVEIQRTLIRSVEVGAMRQQLEALHHRILDRSGHARRIWLPLAAAILLLLGVAAWFIFAPSQHERMVAQYYYAEPGLPIPMSSTDSYQLYDAMADYKMNKYQLAIDKWSRLHLHAPQNDTLNYFIGVAHLAQGGYQASLPYLSQAAHPSGAFAFKAQRQLAYAYLALKRDADLLSIKPYPNSPYVQDIAAMQREAQHTR